MQIVSQLARSGIMARHLLRRPDRHNRPSGLRGGAYWDDKTQPRSIERNGMYPPGSYLKKLLPLSPHRPLPPPPPKKKSRNRSPFPEIFAGPRALRLEGGRAQSTRRKRIAAFPRTADGRSSRPSQGSPRVARLPRRAQDSTIQQLWYEGAANTFRRGVAT